MRRGVLFAAGAFAAATLVASPALANQYVTIKNSQYIPRTVTVKQFDTVFWTHADGDLQHSVTAAPGQAEDFDSSPHCPPSCLQRGDTFKHVFRHAGTFAYYCRVHCPDNSCAADGMRGAIVVAAYATPSPRPAPQPTPTPVHRASSSVSLTTPVPTPSDTPAPSEAPTPSAEPTASPLAAPKTTTSGGIGAALGLVIAGAAIATLGGSLLFVRLRRPKE